MKLILSVVAMFTLVVFLCFGCRHQNDLTGTYGAQSPDGDVELVLKEGGKGTWSTFDDDVPFTWDRRGEEVWLHTKAGGILRGTVAEDGSLHIALPGVGDFNFRKETP